MSKFKTLILEAFILAESEAKVDFLLNNKKLEDSLQRAIQNDPEIENKNITPKELMMSWDKTSHLLSKNIQWLSKQYINGQFFAGDIEKVNNDIQLFTSFGKRYPDLFSSSDLQQYTYSDLKTKIAQINPEDTTKMGTHQKKLYRQAGLKDVKEVYKGSNFTIYVPQTKAAAIALGTNTRWCTATTSSDNMFDTYNTQGPVYILISNHNPNEKYQIHFESGQFMDIDNNPVDIPMFLKDNSEIKNYFKNKIDKTNYLNWAWLDKNELSYEICLKAIKRNHLALQYIPEELKTPKMYLEIVKQNGLALQYIPEEFKTAEICLAAVKEHGLALKYVPKELKTPEICLEAAKNFDDALEYVPKELITPEMCLAAVKEHGLALEYVPEEFKTPEICLAAVKQNSWALGYVPTHIQSLIDLMT